MTVAQPKSLQALMDSVPDLVDYFTNDTTGPHDKDNPNASSVPPEYTTWQEEQRAWRNGVLLFDQCHHMPETFISGPDAVRLLSDVGVNNFNNFGPLKARQYYAVSPEGYFIGESILQHLDDGRLEMISGMHLQNWVHFNAETGDYDVEIVRDHNSADNSHQRTFYRYEIEGPLAMKMFDDLCDGDAPPLALFHMARVTIKGHSVLVLRHSVAGHGGVELSGPSDEGEAMLKVLLETGKKYGMVRGGLKSYYSVLSEVPWVAYPAPGIYTDTKLRPFREWLPATSWEARSQFAGSFRSDNIEDYYVTPWDMGLEKRIQFDRDFIGRSSLENMKNDRHRVKSVLVWDPEDVIRVYRSQFEPGLPFKHMAMPRASYGFQQYDAVYAETGEFAGIAVSCIYTANEARYTSIALLYPEFAQATKELYVLWGELDGGSRKSHVEPHRQTKVKARVASAPRDSGPLQGRRA